MLMVFMPFATACPPPFDPLFTKERVPMHKRRLDFQLPGAVSPCRKHAWQEEQETETCLAEYAFTK